MHRDKSLFKDKTFLLPIPLGREFGKSHFDCDEITYTARDVFLNRQRENNRHWLETGVNVIRAITDVANKYNLKTNFLMAHELRRSSDLTELAKVPLLMSLLVYLRLQQTRLPENRFRAYEILIDQLLSGHPRRRRQAASLTDALLPN